MLFQAHSAYLSRTDNYTCLGMQVRQDETLVERQDETMVDTAVSENGMVAVGEDVANYSSSRAKLL